MPTVITKKTVTEEVDLTFEQLVDALRQLSLEERFKLRDFLYEDELSLQSVALTFGEELTSEQAREHLLAVEDAKQQEATENIEEARRMEEFQRQAFLYRNSKDGRR